MSDVSLILLTLQVATVATVVNIPVALAISWLIVKRRVTGRFILDVAVSLPLAVPPVVVGYALLLVLGREGPIGVLLRKAFGVELVFTWVAAALAAALPASLASRSRSTTITGSTCSRMSFLNSP